MLAAFPSSFLCLRASALMVRLALCLERMIWHSLWPPTCLSPSALELYLICLPVLILSRARNGYRKFCFGSLTCGWAFNHLRTECFLYPNAPLQSSSVVRHTSRTFLRRPERLCLTINLIWSSLWSPMLSVPLVSLTATTSCQKKHQTLTFHTKNIGKIEQCLKVIGS